MFHNGEIRSRLAFSKESLQLKKTKNYFKACFYIRTDIISVFKDLFCRRYGDIVARASLIPPISTIYSTEKLYITLIPEGIFRGNYGK